MPSFGFAACCVALPNSPISSTVALLARARKFQTLVSLPTRFAMCFIALAMFMVMLLPVSGVGYPIAEGLPPAWIGPHIFVTGANGDQQSLPFGVGMVPFIPVLIMVLREVVAGALRSMAATKGLVLAARMSGKLKAWVQGMTIITAFAMPCLLFEMSAWHLWVVAIMTWLCALLSLYSIIEYIVVNKAVLAQLVARRPMVDDADVKSPDSQPASDS